MDTMQMGAAGVAIEREINAQLRADLERLRAENAGLMAACQEAFAVLMGPDCEGTNAVYGAIDCLTVAIASASEAGKGE